MAHIFAVSGLKNTGKTTLIEKLLVELSGRGYLVAVIKHDGHDFEADVPGTDSYRHFQAGAYATAVFSKEKVSVVKKQKDVSEEELFTLFPEADFIILEGFKGSKYPKLVMSPVLALPSTETKEEIAEEDVFAESIIAAATAEPVQFNGKGQEKQYPIFDRDAVQEMALFLLDYFGETK